MIYLNHGATFILDDLVFARAFQSVLSLLKTWKPCISKLGLVPFELKLWHSALPPFTYILNWNKNVLLLKHFLYFKTNYISENEILNAVKRLWEGRLSSFLRRDLRCVWFLQIELVGFIPTQRQPCFYCYCKSVVVIVIVIVSLLFLLLKVIIVSAEGGIISIQCQPVVVMLSLLLLLFLQHQSVGEMLLVCCCFCKKAQYQIIRWCGGEYSCRPNHILYADLAHPYIYCFLYVLCIYADLYHPDPSYVQIFYNVCRLGSPIHLSLS